MPRGVVANLASVADVTVVTGVPDVTDVVVDDHAEQCAQACRRRGGLADAAGVLQTSPQCHDRICQLHQSDLADEGAGTYVRAWHARHVLGSLRRSIGAPIGSRLNLTNPPTIRRKRTFRRDSSRE